MFTTHIVKLTCACALPTCREEPSTKQCRLASARSRSITMSICAMVLAQRGMAQGPFALSLLVWWHRVRFP